MKKIQSWIADQVIAFFVYPVVWLIVRIIEGLAMPGTLLPKGFFKNRPRRGNYYIAIADHVSRHDIPLVAFSLCSCRALFIARTGLTILRLIENNFLGLRSLVEGRLLLFIDIKNLTRSQWRKAREEAKNKKHRVIVIFPHGGTTGKEEIHSGFINLARRSGRLILPIKIKPGGCYGRRYGTESLRKIYTGQACSTKMSVGKPFGLESPALRTKAEEIKLKRGGEKITDQDLAEAAMEMVHEIS